MIRAQGLCKSYGRLRAVDHLDLEVAPGELFGFLGPNGAGKTTTIRMLVGLLQPDAGSAQVAGYDIATQPLAAKAALGFLAETPFLYDKLTGLEYLDFVGGLYRIPSCECREQGQRVLALFDLQDKAHELIESYSHGMRKKLGLCSLLIHNPRVLFLDEPTNGLDPRSARLVKDVLRQLCRDGATVFMSTHIMEIAQNMCDRLGIIHQGRLVAVGTLDELRAQTHVQNSTLEDIFLQLTGGSEAAEMAALLADSGERWQPTD